jgi:hypothetical protein
MVLPRRVLSIHDPVVFEDFSAGTGSKLLMGTRPKLPISRRLQAIGFILPRIDPP